MAVLRVIHTMHARSGLPRDDVQNVFHFIVGEIATPVDANDAIDAAGFVSEFFHVEHVMGEGGLFRWISADISRTNKPTIDVYHLQPNPDPALPWLAGSPIFSSSPPIVDNAIVTTSMPREVAVCVSFHGDLTNIPQSIPGGPPGPEGDTRPAARRRGRLYIGPLSTATGGEDPDLGSRPTSTFRNKVRDCASRLANHNNGLPDQPQWCVLSQRNDAVYPVIGGWVDDAWDTQRRRGLAPTVRSVFSV